MSSHNPTLLPDSGEHTFLCDERIKLDVTEVPAYASLEAVNRLQVNRFRLRNNARRTGLIAQQVKQAMPDAVRISKRTVNGTSFDDFHSISSTTLVSHLVGAVRALSQQVQIQQQQIQQLQVMVFQPRSVPLYPHTLQFGAPLIPQAFGIPAPFVGEEGSEEDGEGDDGDVTDMEDDGSKFVDTLLADTDRSQPRHTVCECDDEADTIECECFVDGAAKWGDAEADTDDTPV